MHPYEDGNQLIEIVLTEQEDPKHPDLGLPIIKNLSASERKIIPQKWKSTPSKQSKQ